MTHPYKNLPDSAFWKRGVGNRHYEDMVDLWAPPELDGSEKFATAGSCFAQHIGRRIAERGDDNYLEIEKAPAGLPRSEHQRFGYDIYSCRYGNIYTSRQLLQISQEAVGERPMSSHVFEKNGRYYDAVRPSVDPIGLDSVESVFAARKFHLSKVSEMLERLDVMVFTLGLTENWLSTLDGTAFPNAPGVVAGSMDDNPAIFQNLKAQEISADLESFWSLLRSINPTAKMILTVSPVPLIATASGNHVLPATMYSKSALRVVAQELVDIHTDIHYFPSYEIINSPQGSGYYFEPDKRSVNSNGVDYVMSHFFKGSLASAFPEKNTNSVDHNIVCDEEAIERQVESDRQGKA